ncbi:MAG TPA: polysaccharide pyruvyl transferase family protein [Humisphaera sp.]
MTHQPTLSRRSLLAAAAVGATAGLTQRHGFAAAPPPKHVLLRSAWQVISLADLAETLGDLALLERHLPGAAVTLWPMYLSEPAEAVVRRRFPKVDVVRGQVDRKTFTAAEPALQAAMTRADLVLHGSGPLVVSPEALEFARVARKPFGVIGVTLNETDEKVVALLSNARFVLPRDSATVDALRRSNLKGPAVGLSPDSAFACDARDDAKAADFLKSAGLADGGFLCVVPKLRYTPFKKYFAPDVVAKREAVNERFVGPDHDKLRAAMVAWVRQTGRRVLVCPELTYQIGLADKLLIDPLPADVKPKVAKRDTFWLPDEAASVLARAAAILSPEMNPAVLALAAGTPAVYLHQTTDGRKGVMLRDLNLGDWALDADDATGEQLAKTVLAIAADPAAAKARVRKVNETVGTLHAAAMKRVAAAAGVAPEAR